MQDNQYPNITDEEIQAMLNSPFAKENEKRVKMNSVYLHEKFLRDFYKRFPAFFNYIFENGDGYLMQKDFIEGELVAISSPIMGTLLRYIEILIKSGKIDEILNILAYLEKGYQSSDLRIKDLVIGFVNDMYIVPDILDKVVELLPPGMHEHFMKYNSDLL